MDKNLPKDPLEEFFKKSLEANNELPAEDGWDVPSDSVWERVEQNIQPATVIRPINYWKWTAIAASVILLFFAYQWMEQNKEIEQLNAELKIQETELENAKDLLQLEKDKNETFYAEENKSPKSNHPSNSSSQNVAENEGVLPPMNTEKSSEDPSFSGQNENGIGGKNNSGIPNIPNAPNNNLANQHSNNITINPSNGSIVENKEEPVEPSNINNSPKTNSDNSKNENDKKETKTIVEFESQNIEILPNRFFKIENPNIEEKLQMDFSSMAALHFSYPEIEKGFYVGAFASRNFGTRKIVGRNTDAANDRRKTLRDSRDKEYWTTGGGVKIGWRLNKYWSLESGIQYTKMEMDIRNRIVRKYTPMGETQVNGEFQNDYALLLVTPFGDAGSDITLSRNTMITDQMPFQVTVGSRVNVSFLGVPLVAKYSIGNEKIRVGLKLGAISNFVLNSDIQVKQISIQTPLLFQRHHVVRDKKEIKNLETATFDFMAGVEAEVQLGPSTYFSLEPSFSRSLTPVFEKQNVKTYPMFSNVKVGLNYYF